MPEFVRPRRRHPLVERLLIALERLGLRSKRVPWRKWAIRRYLLSERSLPAEEWPGVGPANLAYLEGRRALADELREGQASHG